MNVVLTGASSGIGRSLALEFCRYGERVLGIARDESALRELKEICENFDFIVYDLSDLGGLRKIVERATEFGSVDVLVNNAGFGAYRKILDMDPEEIVRMTSVNFLAPILLTKEFLPLMRKGSTVVNVITAGVHVLLASLPLYGATKMALHYASESLRDELRERGVKLITVYPGLVDTQFHSRAGRGVRGGEKPEEVARRIVKAIREGKNRIYTPSYLSILRFLTGPHLLKVK